MKICVDIKRQSNSIAILADFEDSFLIFCPSRLIKKQSQLRDSLRTADAFPVVASLPPKNSYFSEGEKRRPEMRLRFAG